MAEIRTLTVVKLKYIKDDRYVYEVRNLDGICEPATSWGRKLKIGSTSQFEVTQKGNFYINIKLIEDEKAVFNNNRGELLMMTQDLERISLRIKKLLNDTEQ